MSPGIDTVQLIAKAFGITVSRLIGEEESPDLAGYQDAIQAAREYGITPDELNRWIRTTAAIYKK